MQLDINNLSKKYGRKYALREIDLSIHEGVFGLLGNNGAGKSTLMKIIVNLIRDYRGTVKLDGVDIRKDKSYLQQIGYCPQNFSAYGKMSTIDFLEYMGAMKGVTRNITDERVDELSESLDFKHVCNEKLDSLSGGTLQRIGIAQTLLNDPKILILDEPTAGLDIDERRKLREYISMIARDKIVIISTHIVSDIDFISDSLAIIKQGRVAKTGKTEELLSELDGKVFQAKIPATLIRSMEQYVLVTNYRNYDQTTMVIKYISNTKLTDDSISVKPELNDYYLYANHEELL